MTLYPPNSPARAVPVRGIPVISFNRFSFPPPPSSSHQPVGLAHLKPQHEPSHAAVTVPASWVGSIPAGLMRLPETSWACCLLRWRIRELGVPSAVTKEMLLKEHSAVPSRRLSILWTFRTCGCSGGFCSNRTFIQCVHICLYVHGSVLVTRPILYYLFCTDKGLFVTLNALEWVDFSFDSIL